MPLLPSQEAWVFEQLVEAGFDPREFTLDERTVRRGAKAPVLSHRPTGYYYAFALHPQAHRGYWVMFSPADDRPVGEYGSGAWDSVVEGTFGRWLQRIHRELEAPDYWGELRRENELVAGPAAVEENTPFSAEERAEIQANFDELKTLLRGTYALTEAQFEAIDARLDYLADAAARLGRIDWREALVGALLGLVVQSIVPAEPVRTALSIVTQGLGHLFGIHVPPAISSG